MIKFNPSPYQLEIFQFILHEKGHAVINAVAGSGKTTTIVNAVNLIKGRSKLNIAFVAFNNHIVEELKLRLPSGVTVSTMHKMGLNWIIKANNGTKPEIDSFGWSVRDKIVRFALSQHWFEQYDHLKKFEEKEEMLVNIKRYCTSLNELVTLCKANLSLRKNEIASAAFKYGFDGLTDIDFERLEQFFNSCYKSPDLSEITFEDMIFLPAIGLVETHKYDYLFVDECQDLNKAQQKCLDLMLKEKGRLIAVGDPKQAIYGFAGADSESFSSIANRPNTKSLPLSVCYRCGRHIIEFTKSIMPTIETHNRAHSGEVRYGSYREIKGSDFVLCRFNAPLVSLWFDLLRQNKKSTIKGGTIGLQLISVIENHNPDSIQELLEKLFKDLEFLSKKLIKSGLDIEQVKESSKYKEKMDEINVIRVIGEQSRTIEEIKKRIRVIFNDKIEGITLSSIHKSKGLEADRVFILVDDFAPSAKATKEWEIEQENNLIYVAYTRAKKELIFINDFELYDVKPQMLFRSSRFDEFLRVNKDA